MITLYAAENLLSHPQWKDKIESLGFTLISGGRFCLGIDEDGLVLELPGGQLKLDWQRTLTKLRAQKLGTKNDLFARALRPTGSGRIESVLDLTCGTGRDTLHLYALGLSVVSLERDPYLYVLSHFECERLKTNSLQVQFAQAAEFLEVCESFDVIFYDPMYEDTTSAKKRKAAPRKEIQLFYDYFMMSEAKSEKIDEEESIILQLARTKARRRVIVKRALAAGPILTPVPYSYQGKSTRYDGYPPLGGEF